jgi:Predicted permeases
VTETLSRPKPLALISVGVIGGLLAGFFGVGGGVVMVPLLLLWAGMDQRRAQATSLLAIAPAALIGTASYAIGGVFPVIPALLVALGALGGAQLGALLLRKLSLGWLEWAFLTFVFVMSSVVLITVPDRGVSLIVDIPVGLALLTLGVVMGSAAGLFGIGGGIVVIPTLMILFGVGDLEAKGVSLIAMAPAALSGSFSHLRHKVATLRDGLWVALAALIATPLGSLGAFAIPEQLANIIFGSFGLIIGTTLFIRAIRKRRKTS